MTGLCEGNSPVNFSAQRASNMENDSIWWRHHELIVPSLEYLYFYLKNDCIELSVYGQNCDLIALLKLYIFINMDWICEQCLYDISKQRKLSDAGNWFSSPRPPIVHISRGYCRIPSSSLKCPVPEILGTTTKLYQSYWRRKDDKGKLRLLHYWRDCYPFSGSLNNIIFVRYVTYVSRCPRTVRGRIGVSETDI